MNTISEKEQNHTAMNRVIYLIGVLMLSSCSTAFQQIATISSKQMSVSNDGKYSYVDGDIVVDYDFWAQNGHVKFVITNNSDNDVYVDLERTFLVVNGMVFDYFQNRSWSTHSSSTLVSSYTYGGSNTFARATGTAGAVVSSYGDFINADAYGVVTGTSTRSSYSHRTTASTTVNRGLQYQEKEGVWIPAHSSRRFSEFSLLESPYRKCGFARDPKKDENVTLQFDFKTSPYVFDNVLTLVINGEDHRIVNSFYEESISNYKKKDTYDEIPEEYCDESKTGRKLWVYKYRAANRFYIDYDFYPNTGLGGNDRTTNTNSRKYHKFSKNR